MKKTIALILVLALVPLLFWQYRQSKKEEQRLNAMAESQKVINWLLDNSDLDAGIEPGDSAADADRKREINYNRWVREWIYGRQYYLSLSWEDQDALADGWILEIDPDIYFDS